MRFSSPSFVLNYFSLFFISYDDGKCFSSVELHSFSSVFGGQVWISHSYKLYNKLDPFEKFVLFYRYML